MRTYTTPQVSIIIPSWNTSRITLTCVNTIISFLPKNYAQIIIVDNGSSDDTEQVFSKLKTVTYIKNSTNLGFSKANNIGFKSAIAKYLLFLNSDMELTDSKIVNMVEYLEENSHIGIIGPKFLNPDLSSQGSVFPSQSPANAFKEFWLGQNSFSKYTPANTKPTKVWAISGGAMLIKKQLFIDIGKWDEKYFMFFEDLAICRNVQKLGKEIYYYPNCKVIHRHGASGKTVANPQNQWKRLIPSSKRYHGLFTHYLLFLITWTSQKLLRRS